MVPSPWRRCEWAGRRTVVGDVVLHGEPVRLGQEVHHVLTGVGEAGRQRRLATARGDQQFVPADLLGGDVLLCELGRAIHYHGYSSITASSQISGNPPATLPSTRVPVVGVWKALEARPTSVCHNDIVIIRARGAMILWRYHSLCW